MGQNNLQSNKVLIGYSCLNLHFNVVDFEGLR